MGFFDDLSSSFQESVNKTQKESKYKRTISENKKKVEETYSEIGKMIYQKRNMDEELITYINSKVEDIDRMVKENEELNREILILNNKKICPNCGKEVELNTAFCPSCGAEQEKISVEIFVPKGKRKCPGCEAIIDDKSVFCPNCGAKKEEPITGEVITEPVSNSEIIENQQTNSETVAEEDKDSVDENTKIEEKIDDTETDIQNKTIGVEDKEEILNQPVSKEVEIDFISEEESKEEHEEKKEPRKCRNCGEQLEENDVFCANCGTKNE